jgi:cardiolipin synthase
MATQEHAPDATMESIPTFEIDSNRLTPVIEGADRLAALLAVITAARQDLRLLYYIFTGDAVGAQVRDALIAACGRGVKVSLLIDGFGSEHTPDDFFQPLKDAGGSVCRFLPRYGRSYLLRNHQKIALADRDRALIGGFNIDADYFADIEAQGWRDFGLTVEGPAAAHLAGYFDAILGWARNPRAKIRTLNNIVGRWSEKRGRLRWSFGGPNRRLSPWARALKHDMATAKRLDVIAAYFAPNPGTLRRIGRIAKRGAVRIMTASKSDNNMTIAAARHCYARLLRRNARIWEYQPTRLHTKIFVVEDVAYVGSANFDMRSLYLNLEIMLRIEDAGFATWLRGHVDREAVDSREATLDLLRTHAGWLTRLKWRIAYFVVGVVDYTVTRRLNFGSAGAVN